MHDMEYQETILQGVQSFTLAGLEMAHGRENCWYRTQKTFMDYIKLSSDEIADEIDAIANGAKADVFLNKIINTTN